jgi:outer membrane protein TolC
MTTSIDQATEAHLDAVREYHAALTDLHIQEARAKAAQTRFMAAQHKLELARNTFVQIAATSRVQS